MNITLQTAERLIALLEVSIAKKREEISQRTPSFDTLKEDYESLKDTYLDEKAKIDTLFMEAEEDTKALGILAAMRQGKNTIAEFRIVRQTSHLEKQENIDKVSKKRGTVFSYVPAIKSLLTETNRFMSADDILDVLQERTPLLASRFKSKDIRSKTKTYINTYIAAHKTFELYKGKIGLTEWMGIYEDENKNSVPKPQFLQSFFNHAV